MKAGYAWYYRQYAGDVPAENRAAYERAEAEARSAKRGLWEQLHPLPPWEFRHGNKLPASGPTTQASSGKIIGNRNSMVYHLPNCPDYQKIAEKNRIYFNSAEEAEKAGFRRARNCP